MNAKSRWFVVLLVNIGILVSPCALAAEQAQTETPVEHAIKHLDSTYVCPMHPQIVRDKPGKCPICGMDLVEIKVEPQKPGEEKKVLYYRHPHNPTTTADRPMKDEVGMDYVPVYDDGGRGVTVKISPTVVNNMGVRSEPVERGDLSRRIETVGYVDLDEQRISHIHLRADGWVENLVVKSQGERVRRGEVLLELYSPTLVNAQQEYLQAVVSGNSTLTAASRERLIALGVSADQITELHNSGKVRQNLKIYAPQDGVVTALNIREGMYIKPATEVMTLADLSTIWVLAELFERHAAWVHPGQAADVRLSSLPGRVWGGKVEYVYPSLDPKTRTLKVRLKFGNPDEALKPNMFANITIHAQGVADALRVRREAVIRTGREERVIVYVGDGRFRSQKVTTGIESGDWIEIMAGLEGGERVVMSGQFLIDSEASLKASILRLSGQINEPEPAEVTAAKTVTGTGIVKTIMPTRRKVNLAHDPIPEIGWPSMTMDMAVKDEVSLDVLSPGDRIEFELERRENGYIISAVRKRKL